MTAHVLETEGCELGDPEACAVVGADLLDGHGVQADDVRGVALLSEACKAASARACGELGRLHTTGKHGLSFDTKLAARLCDASCPADPRACVCSGDLRAWGALPFDARAAERYFTLACNGHIALGCTQLADAIAGGKLTADPKRAAQLYERGCELGSARGCAKRAESLGKAEHAKAIDLRLRACELAPGDACLELAFDLWEDVERDPTRLRAALQKGCAAQVANACHYLRVVNVQAPPSEGEHAKALAELEAGCERKERLPCGALARLTWFGRGVPKDLGRAEKLLRGLCESDDPWACESLYWVVKELAASTHRPLEPKLLEKSCDLGLFRGCLIFAARLRDGKEVPKDAQRSAALNEWACNEGYLNACNNWGDQLEKGDGVQRDYAHAMKLYQRACDGDVGVGCEGVGTLLAGGLGVPKDTAKAEEMFLKGCELDAFWCVEWAQIVARKDRGKARELLDRACKLENKDACAAAKRLPAKP